VSILKSRITELKSALTVGSASKAGQLASKLKDGRLDPKMKKRNLTFHRKRDYGRKQKWL